MPFIVPFILGMLAGGAIVVFVAVYSASRDHPAIKRLPPKRSSSRVPPSNF